MPHRVISMNSDFTFFATTPKRMEPLLAEELRQLGAWKVTETRAGVSFQGTVELAYRVCLWSRLASRILLPLATFSAKTPEELYEGVRSIPWKEHLNPQGTLAVNCQSSGSPITHSRYGALKVKDAIVDQFRETFGVRPSVDVFRPDVRINAYLYRDKATVGLDLSGESLHRRGYREEGVLAPLKENLAAAILLRCGWPSVARKGGALLDPMCGSGTLPIEAALMAADIAPGLLRPYFGFIGWKGHDISVWERLVAEAKERRVEGLSRLPDIVGYDADSRAVKKAWTNAKHAGLQGRVHFERRELAALETLSGKAGATGLVVVNPPYGKRLGEAEELKHLYAELGERLKEHFLGWKAAVFTGNPDLGKKLGLRARRIHTLYNGALECKLLQFDIDPQWFFRETGKRGKGTLPRHVK